MEFNLVMLTARSYVAATQVNKYGITERKERWTLTKLL